ncbi:MAG: hypothetical protein IPI67_37810 [Myxococcales bacterium]|nr:hypothetical protein [Myxococcales bacterium]
MKTLRSLVQTGTLLVLISGLAGTSEAQVPGGGYQQVRLPSRPGAGDPVEETLLLETPYTKVATITLRRGAELPERSYASPVTIQALHGSGTLKLASGEVLRIGPRTMLSFASRTRHAVRPGMNGYLTLLVQHTKVPGA